MDNFLAFEFMQRAFVTAILIGISVGIVSPLIVIRRLSLIGDGLAHLAFAGIALGFLLNINPMLSALVFIIIGSLVIKKMIEKNVYGEAAIALILSFGIGVGIIIIGATKGFGVSLFSYLIGSLLTTTWIDAAYIGALCIVVIIFMLYFKRELFLLTFQKEVAHMQSARTNIADTLFSIIIALIVITAIQAVGILLVTALLVIPGLIAIKIGKSFNQSILISTGVAICAGIFGLIGSYYANVPPSGFIVILLLCIYVLVAVIKKGMK